MSGMTCTFRMCRTSAARWLKNWGRGGWGGSGEGAGKKPGAEVRPASGTAAYVEANFALGLAIKDRAAFAPGALGWWARDGKRGVRTCAPGMLMDR